MSLLCFKEQERTRINEAVVNRLHTEVIPPKYSGPFQNCRDVAPKSIRSLKSDVKKSLNIKPRSIYSEERLLQHTFDFKYFTKDVC